MAAAGAAAHAAERVVFVTVGTTRFDALIDAMDSPGAARALARRGYTALVMQVGAHARAGSRLLSGGEAGAAEGLARTAGRTADGLRVEWFDYSPSLAAHIAGAALVVSHAGAGSVFETLAARVPLVVVPNPLLMDDHQAELARKLEGMGVLQSATLDTLAQVLDAAEFDGLQPYQPGSAAPMVAALDRLMGFTSQ